MTFVLLDLLRAI